MSGIPSMLQPLSPLELPPFKLSNIPNMIPSNTPSLVPFDNQKLQNLHLSRSPGSQKSVIPISMPKSLQPWTEGTSALPGDLELTSAVAHNEILIQAVPIQHVTSCMFSDNMPAVSWCTKGNTTTKGQSPIFCSSLPFIAAIITID